MEHCRALTNPQYKGGVGGSSPLEESNMELKIGEWVGFNWGRGKRTWEQSWVRREVLPCVGCYCV